MIKFTLVQEKIYSLFFLQEKLKKCLLFVIIIEKLKMN